jgi:hypothetical protein
MVGSAPASRSFFTVHSDTVTAKCKGVMPSPSAELMFLVAETTKSSGLGPLNQ